MKRNLRKISALTLAILIFSSQLSLGEKLSFSDVKEENWFYKPVMSLVDLGYIKGYEDGSFKPKGEITLGEFIYLIMTATGHRDYVKIEGRHWAYDAYLDAVVKAVIDTSNFKATRESLNTAISREDMAYILVGVSENILGEEPIITSGLETKIKDLNRADPLRVDSILTAYGKGLVNGREGDFHPKDKLSRSEASTIIIRLLDKNERIR